MSEIVVRRANRSDGSCSGCHREADYLMNLNGLTIRTCDSCFRHIDQCIKDLPAICHACGQEKPRKRQ